MLLRPCSFADISLYSVLQLYQSCTPSDTAHSLVAPGVPARSIPKHHHHKKAHPPLEPPAGRRLLAGGGGWDGSVTAQTILSENDAKAGIVTAVNTDQYGATYQSTLAGYMDAAVTTFPDNIASEAGWWPCLLGWAGLGWVEWGIWARKRPPRPLGWGLHGAAARLQTLD